MDGDTNVIKQLYKDFNARNIDEVLVMLTGDVMWANAMDGGYAHGHDAIRAYWTRQWSIVDPHVEPVRFTPAHEGSIVVEVIQPIRNLDGSVVHGEPYGLRDKTVGHIFHFRGGKVSRFDVQDIPEPH
jgi:hypothetical protein